MCLPLNPVIWKRSILTDVVIEETGAAGANLPLKHKRTSGFRLKNLNFEWLKLDE